MPPSDWQNDKPLCSALTADMYENFVHYDSEKLILCVIPVSLDNKIQENRKFKKTCLHSLLPHFKQNCFN
jgi:hypothetical protein